MSNEKIENRIFETVQQHVANRLASSDVPTLPTTEALRRAEDSLHKYLPEIGAGLADTTAHLLTDVAGGLNGSSLSPNYYGFVTGGITPAARVADNLVTLYDQNTSVHLPNESVATALEDRALTMLLQLLDFEPQQWPARTFTTGATASNILGLACGREYTVSSALAHKHLSRLEGEGLLSSTHRAGIERFQILTTLPHSSLGKAANILGLGSASMVDVSRTDHFLDFDMAKLEHFLQLPGTANIVVISCGEVNTGAFATHSLEEVQTIRALCDKYNAWLHVDGAFGLFARALPTTPAYTAVRSGTLGLHLADSITGDAHKLLNVPYDCGFFLSRHAAIPPAVFANTNAAYLSTTATDSIPAPLNNRLENSARFRGLPVYATLAAYGRQGYADMLGRMVDLARRIAGFVRDDCEGLELLPRGIHGQGLGEVHICVLFRARDEALNRRLVEDIKASRRVYVSGTMWEGEPAVRFAVAKWDVDVERDFAVVRDVLRSVL